MIYRRKENLWKIPKLMIFLMIIFVLVYESYHKDIYPLLALEGYQEAGLRFYYSIFDSSIELKITILLLLLPSNVFPYELLQEKNNRFSYMIKTRIGTKRYLVGNYFKNFVKTLFIYLVIHFFILIFIHSFLVPIKFGNNLDQIMMQSNLFIFSDDSFISLMFYILLSSLGYATFSCLVLLMKNLFKYNYYFRAISLLLGIVLIALPAIIGFKFYSVIPNDYIFNLFNALFLPSLITPGLQSISGIELMIHPLILYLISFIIYNFCSIIIYYLMSRMEYKNE